MITEADEAMLWLRWLDKDVAQILWARSNRWPWKKVCWHQGISRPTASRRYEYGLAVIALQLNGKPLQRKRSMEFVIGQTV